MGELIERDGRDEHATPVWQERLAYTDTWDTHGGYLHAPDRGANVTTRTLTIQGMSCGHCVKAVTMALQDLPGVDVKDVRVGQAVIEADEQVTGDHLTTAIDEAGFTLTQVTSDAR